MRPWHYVTHIACANSHFGDAYVRAQTLLLSHARTYAHTNQKRADVELAESELPFAAEPTELASLFHGKVCIGRVFKECVRAMWWSMCERNEWAVYCIDVSGVRVYVSTEYAKDRVTFVRSCPPCCVCSSLTFSTPAAWPSIPQLPWTGSRAAPMFVRIAFGSTHAVALTAKGTNIVGGQCIAPSDSTIGSASLCRVHCHAYAHTDF